MLAPELSVPALFAAGLLSAPHCALMCGPLQGWMLVARGDLPAFAALLWLQGGRLLGYAALGAIAGAAGAAMLGGLPSPGIGQALQVMAALTLSVVALRKLRRPRPAACHARRVRLPGMPAPLRLVVQGAAWSALPCGLLYSALLLATLAGGAATGAALLLAYGVGTLPALLAAGGAQLHMDAVAGGFRRAASAALAAFGLAGAYAAAAHAAWLPPAWCAPAMLLPG